MNSAWLCLIAAGGASSLVLMSDPPRHSAASGPVAAASSGQSVSRVPGGVILVTGASPSASDSVTPVPEDARINGRVFDDPYFQMSFPLPEGWAEKYTSPPPSDSGRYVLAQIAAADSFSARSKGSLLITAQDIFFTSLPAMGARETIESAKNHLPEEYRVEPAPERVWLGDREFSTFAYESPQAQLHWRVLATEIRCHIVEFVVTGRDSGFIETAMRGLNKMKLPAEENPAAGPFPVCVKDFARGDNLLRRVDPVLTGHRFNPVPVRIIIDRKGAIRHIHFLSAFSDQARAISDALAQWRFKPYIADGQPVEVETGILFGPQR